VFFKLTPSPIQTDLLKQQFENPCSGGYVSFEGWVRNHHEGKSVASLEYEAYSELAEAEAYRILEEAQQRFQVLDVGCVHRTGHLAIGECAVWVGVVSEHRKEAFEACQYIIDEIKHRLPVWKKEFYTDGSIAWVNCQRCAASASKYHAVAKETVFSPTEAIENKGLMLFSDAEKQFYARQMVLPEVGFDGQERLRQSKVLVVGAGGLGSAALPYLAAAGVGTLGICEFDILNTSNLHRQILYRYEDIGRPKSSLATETLQALNPFIKINTHTVKLDPQNITSLLKQYDLIVDGTDNFTAKFLINDAAVALQKPVVFASVYQYEGQLWSYLPDQQSPCLRCLWPEESELDCVGTCTETGVLGVVPGVLGVLQANQALKWLLNLSGESGAHRLILMDLRSLTTTTLQRERLPYCPTCGKKGDMKVNQPSPLTSLHDEQVLELSFDDIQTLAEVGSIQWVDIRDKTEQDVYGKLPFSFTVCTTLKTLPPNLSNGPTVVVCQHGLRSHQAVKRLRQQGINNVFSLQGGAAVLLRQLV